MSARFGFQALPPNPLTPHGVQGVQESDLRVLLIEELDEAMREALRKSIPAPECAAFDDEMP